MGNPATISLSLKFAAVAFAFSSFSLTLTSSSSSSLPFVPKISLPNSSRSSSSSKVSSPSPAQKLASDLLSLLGGPSDASAVDLSEARQLRSCLRFLVPFKPTRSSPSSAFEKVLECHTGRNDEEMVWWPPAAVMELARIAFDSGGDAAAIHRCLDPTPLPVPDVECRVEDKCELTRTPYGRRFVNKELNSYMAFLFELIASRAPSVGFNLSLSRYDLFHGHLFIAPNSGRLGILFHAKEYPAYDKAVFPYNMGYCQTGSVMAYDDSMNLRNILWLAPLPSNAAKAWVAPGVLVVLDAHPGGIIYKKMVPEYVDYVRTIYEDFFGEIVVDVNYLNVGNVVAGDKIFIC